MPRSKKCRKICFLPDNRVFSSSCGSDDYVTLMLDEFEAMHLCDLEHMDQDSAAKNMNISRGTYQRILYSAHEKVTDALVNGKNINIDGGNCEVLTGGCSCSNLCKTCPKLKYKNGHSSK